MKDKVKRDFWQTKGEGRPAVVFGMPAQKEQKESLTALPRSPRRTTNERGIKY